MKRFSIIAFVLICVLFLGASRIKKERVLIFSPTKGYRHASIKEGKVLIAQLGNENNFDVDSTEDPAKFNYDNLKQYKAIVFLSPTGEFFNEAEKLAFQKYIRKGGGFVGIHAATDCLFNWPWYGKLVGAYFSKHPKVQPASLIVADQQHLSTKGLATPWTHTDEWYNFKNVNPDIKVLVSVDEKGYTGGEMGNHPISWYHKFEGGRVFYTGLGHTARCYTADQQFKSHLLGGIKYALGRKE